MCSSRRIEGDKRIVRLFDPWQQRNVWQAPPLSPTAKCFAWQQEVVALMEPEGRVLLVNLADGRTLVDEKVEPVTSRSPTRPPATRWRRSYLIGSRDHFVLVANSVSQHDIAVNTVQPMPFGYTQSHQSARARPRVRLRSSQRQEALDGRGLSARRVAGAAQRAAAGVLCRRNATTRISKRVLRCKRSPCCRWISARAARCMPRRPRPAPSPTSSWWAIRRSTRST